ncbi:hypothetical protein CspHIS471_0402010 [Cutaneotrichosporon sp. HIS471]|nr:hypothetical protein CspHIS471_0402010 [Cutaneotrichosporon sp. HIS471]
MTTSLHLPIEVLAAIVRFIDDRPTLAALMSVSSATYDLAARPLYAEIVVTHHKLAGYRVGLLAFRPAPGEALGGYPNTVSDRRKRALLALTTTIRPFGQFGDTTLIDLAPFTRSAIPRLSRRCRQVPRQPPSVPEHNQSSRSPYLSIEVEAAAAARRRSAISKGLNSHSPVNGEIRRRATLESGEQQPENVALPVTVTRPSLQATSEYARNDQTSKPSQATYSTLTDNAEHLGSLQSAREHRLSDPFDLEEVDLNDVNMDEVDDFLALYDLPTVEGCNHPLSLSLSTTPWSSSSQARKDMKPLTTQGTTSSDPIVLSPSSAPSCPVLHPERLGRRPSLKRPHSPDVCAVETLAAAVHPKKRLRIAPQLDQPTHIPKKQPLLFKNVRDEVTTATIADLVAAVSAEVPGSANIPSAAELVASFNAFSSEGRERAANIIDSCHPFVLTRGALETILSFVSDNDFRGETPPLVLLGALIVFGRLEQATKLIFQDLPGGNLNYDEHFPACKTTKLLAVAHKCLAPPIASRGLSAVLCPKVITVIIRQSAAEDLFDNSHISMNYLSLLASPSNLCVDFDLSFRGSTDIDCNLTFHDEEHQIGRRHEKLDDMAPERGVILGDLVKSVWPSVHVVSFHRGAGKTLPYCGIAVKHVVYCGGGRFCKAEVSFQKRLMTLNTWRENAAEVFFKEVLRVEMQRTTRRKKSTNQPTDDSRRTEMTKRVTLPPILPSRGGATWTTINPVWAAEEAAKRAEERTPMVAKAPLDEAMWDIHLDQLPRNKFLADLEDRVEQLVAEREERDSTKIKKRHVEGVNLKLWMNEEVSCDCCETVCFDTRQPGQAGKKQSSTTKKAATRESSTRKSTRAKKMQGKDGKTRGRSRYKSALARMRYEYE